MGRHESSYDVIIVGGSVAGAATAWWLGRRGFRVLILDRARFPRDKPCGEGLMPTGVKVLSEMGLLSRLWTRGARPFYGIRFYDRHGCQVAGTFPQSAEWPGLIIRRLWLDALLLQHAASLPSVDVRQGIRVTRILHRDGRVCGVAGKVMGAEPADEEQFLAPVTIGADGLHSMFHRLPGVRVRRPRRPRFGVTAHLRGVEGLGTEVEVITQSWGELYLAAQDEDAALVALLLDRAAMRPFVHDLEAGFWQTLHAFPPFAERIEHSERISPILATGPLGSRVWPCFGDGFLLVGDSAGAVDPITGEGMSLSLRSAQVAARAVAQAFRAGDFGARRWTDYGLARRSMARPFTRLADFMLFLSRHQRLGHWTIHMLRRRPSALQKLLASAAGEKHP
ncbi:MAG: NAD(P)/FAD-dependent oxidoreductase [Acidobacteria bacterium]|nr:MAG: NAD(P)/FAD-dependent oxidoreductase [Acidobacteriota bacterium]